MHFRLSGSINEVFVAYCGRYKPLPFVCRSFSSVCLAPYGQEINKIMKMPGSNMSQKHFLPPATSVVFLIVPIGTNYNFAHSVLKLTCDKT